MPSESEWTLIVSIVSAASAVASTFAAVFSWKTATRAHTLQTRMAEQAAQDAVALGLERLVLGAATLEAESERLHAIAAHTKKLLASKMLASGGAGAATSSRYKQVVEALDKSMSDALEAGECAKSFRKAAESKTGDARDLRIRAAELTLKLRGQISQLEVEREGWFGA